MAYVAKAYKVPAFFCIFRVNLKREYVMHALGIYHLAGCFAALAHILVTDQDACPDPFPVFCFVKAGVAACVIDHA